MSIMWRIPEVILLIFVFLPDRLWGNTDSLLQVLETEIQQRPRILAEKKAQFAILHEKLKHSKHTDSLFIWQYDLCTLYQSFSYDSASQEVRKLLLMARQSGDREKIAKATIKQAFILLSAGIFQEALDSLAQIRAADLSIPTKALFFHTRARGYLDLADYCSDRYYQPLYKKQGLTALDSAIYYARFDSIYLLSLAGLRALEQEKYTDGVGIYRRLLENPALSTRQMAIEATSASAIYSGIGQQEASFRYLILGAIADERSCVKESTALARVAACLFEKSDYERANRFINLALEDANFFGARLRKMQIIKILPIINERQLTLYKENRNNLIWFSVILGMLLLLCAGLIVMILRKNHILRKKELDISDSYRQLEQYAGALRESDHIKEKYIGHFFQSNTKLIDKIGGVIRQAKKAMDESNVRDSKFYLDQFSPNNEHKKLLRDFDHSFLDVFPGFVEQFNLLFEEKDRIVLENDQLLNTELRIFALLRLGITNNEIIAKALHYSVNTIYTYKTKVRNRSFLSAEAFDEAVMKISAVSG